MSSYLLKGLALYVYGQGYIYTVCMLYVTDKMSPTCIISVCLLEIAIPLHMFI